MKDNVPALRPAPTDLPINRLIAGRWSSRAMDSTREVDSSVMNRLFEAARWAPSAANNQPWRFLSFGPENEVALEKARTALTPGNAWALAAPRLLFILTRMDRPGSGKPNPRAVYEAGMSALAMALQASDEGLIFHQMAGFDEKAVRGSFPVPENFAVITAAAVGWPGTAESVPEDKRVMESAERVRKGLDEIVFSDGKVPVE